VNNVDLRLSLILVSSALLELFFALFLTDLIVLFQDCFEFDIELFEDFPLLNY